MKSMWTTILTYALIAGQSVVVHLNKFEMKASHSENLFVLKFINSHLSKQIRNKLLTDSLSIFPLKVKGNNLKFNLDGEYVHSVIIYFITIKKKHSTGLSPIRLNNQYRTVCDELVSLWNALYKIKIVLKVFNKKARFFFHISTKFTSADFIFFMSIVFELMNTDMIKNLVLYIKNKIRVGFFLWKCEKEYVHIRYVLQLTPFLSIRACTFEKNIHFWNIW